MKSIASFPCQIRELEHIEVPMPDGCRLAARVWMPIDAESRPVPAILEYIPYRKNDLTAARDAGMHPYVAGHGYAVVRLDLRGAGESEGVLLDEYLEQELRDGCDAIQWIADQPWCDGSVGMVGISWGGFNGLQIAAMRPPALKAVISLCSTVDRYEDDVHYMGGCLLIDQLSWASVMFGRNTLPPDPRHVGERWRDMWLERLEHSGLWLKNWLEHQRRDAFWKHGSVCEDWDRIQVPIYAVSGWADGYCRTVFKLIENLKGPRKGLIGPWAHKYPHIGQPQPAIGFLQEALRWWDHWLKAKDTGIMDEPVLRLFMQDPAPPASWYEMRGGRWVAEPSWPSPNIVRTSFTLGGDRRLSVAGDAASEAIHIHHSPLSVGMMAGKWCSYAQAGDQPTDQRNDDAASLCFETEPLAKPFEIAGDARLTLDFSVDREIAQVAARLVDVAPDGAATRVAFGVLNLTHRNGHEAPEALVPGERYQVMVPFKPVATRFEAGHRIRLAISTSYFPLIWPSPQAVTISLHSAGSTLDLPVRTDSPLDAMLADFSEAEGAPDLAIQVIERPNERWQVIHELDNGMVRMEVGDGSGTFRIVGNDLTVRNQGYESYRVQGDDPASASGEITWEHAMSRDDWCIRTETRTRLTANATHFVIEAELRAFEGNDVVHERSWFEEIPRDGN